MLHSACSDFNPITGNNYASLFNCMGRMSDPSMASDLKLFVLVGLVRDFLSVACSTGVQLVIFSGVVWQSRGDLELSRNTLYLSIPRL